MGKEELKQKIIMDLEKLNESLNKQKIIKCFNSFTTLG